MSVPNREDLLSLVEVQAKPCLSVYLCTDRRGAETMQNPIRLKNLLRRAEDQLVATGVRPADSCEMLQPAYELLQESSFWRHLGDGLALFLTRDLLRTYTVPLGFDEQIVVNNRFYIKPLLPLLVGDGRFYILALSQGGVRMYEGTRDSVSPIELANIPANMREALHIDEAGSLQFHTAQSAGGGERAGMFYGTDADDNNYKRNIVQYFHEVDRGLRETIQDEQAPLVLAGVEYLLPLYREANTYAALLKQEIATGTDPLDGQELHARAWPLVEPIFTAARAKAIELYRQLSGASSVKASPDIREVVPAAYYGRVGTLLVDECAQEWGSFDPANGSVKLPASNGNAEDLLDLAALYTLKNKGTVYAVGREQMPTASPVAALFRY